MLEIRLTVYHHDQFNGQHREVTRRRERRGREGSSWWVQRASVESCEDAHFFFGFDAAPFAAALVDAALSFRVCVLFRVVCVSGLYA